MNYFHIVPQRLQAQHIYCIQYGYCFYRGKREKTEMMTSLEKWDRVKSRVETEEWREEKKVS